MKKPSFLRRSDLCWLSLVVLGILLQFWWLPGTVQPPDDSYSNSIDGKLGFYRVLESVFHDVRRERDKLIPDEICVLVMVAPERYPNEREQQQLASFVNRGGALVFAPNWSVNDARLDKLNFELEEIDGWRSDGNESEGDATTPAAEDGPDSADGESSEPNSDEDDTDLFSDKEHQIKSALTGTIFTTRTRSAFLETPYASDEIATSTDGSVFASSWFYGDGVIAVCTSPDVFSNLSMTDNERALFAVKLIEHAFEKSPLDRRLDGIVVSEYYNVASNYRYSGILFSPALRSSSLQVIVIGILFAWFSFHRFGPAEKVSTTRRRTLEDSARAVGNLLYRSSDGGAAVRNYLEYVSSRLRREHGRTVTLDNAELLSSRSGIPVEQIRKRLQICRAQAATPNISSTDAAESIRWLTRLIGGASAEKLAKPADKLTGKSSDKSISEDSNPRETGRSGGQSPTRATK